jgi:hypothetical protein
LETLDAIGFGKVFIRGRPDYKILVGKRGHENPAVDGALSEEHRL